MIDEIFMKMSEEKKELYLEPYAKRCKKCSEIYPRNKDYFHFNSQSNPIYCLKCKEKLCKKKNKKNEKIINEQNISRNII